MLKRARYVPLGAAFPYREENFLHHVFRFFRGLDVSEREVVELIPIIAIQLLECSDIAGADPPDQRLIVAIERFRS